MREPRRFHLSFRTVLFIGLHVLCGTAFLTGVSSTDLIVGAVVYSMMMFGVTAGYHRYFAHRTYQMARVPQFLMASLAMSSAQKSVLWWAAHHRHHHRHSDTEQDLHSPHQDGFWYSHVGWVLDEQTDDTDLSKVKDLARYPELMWLHRHELVPALVLGTVIWALFGWSGLVVGFLWALVATWHCTFTINSLSHVWGSRRYDTRD
ncbi:MAG: stearoyl-CoA desaturase (delta-9 desaturase), partial [Bradymonadia bacterium]